MTRKSHLFTCWCGRCVPQKWIFVEKRDASIEQNRLPAKNKARSKRLIPAKRFANPELSIARLNAVNTIRALYYATLKNPRTPAPNRRPALLMKVAAILHQPKNCSAHTAYTSNFIRNESFISAFFSIPLLIVVSTGYNRYWVQSVQNDSALRPNLVLLSPAFFCRYPSSAAVAIRYQNTRQFFSLLSQTANETICVVIRFSLLRRDIAATLNHHKVVFGDEAMCCICVLSFKLCG